MINYRSDTVAAMYTAVSTSSAVLALFPKARLIKDDANGRVSRLVFRQIADFPYLQIRIGDRDSGIIFGGGTFDHEAGVVSSDVNRSAEYIAEFVYNPNANDREDDAARDQLENTVLAAIADTGPHLIAGIVHLTFRRQQGMARQGDRDIFASRVVLTATYIFQSADVLPVGA